MRVLYIFQSGARCVGDTIAMVLPENPSNISQKIPLDLATDEEFESLKVDPNNEALLTEIKERS